MTTFPPDPSHERLPRAEAADGLAIPAEPGAAVEDEQALRDLLPGLRAGDPAAARVLYERHQPTMRAYFAGRLPGRGRADDCVNEVFVRALAAFRKGQAPDSVDKWLWGIARHVLASREGLDDRSWGDRPLETVTEGSGGRPSRAAATGDVTGEAAYDAVGIRQALSDVRAVIRTFPARRRELMDAFFTLSLAEGHEVKGGRLAAALGKGWTEKGVNRELHRARLAVRHSMGVLAVARAARACPEASALIPQLAQQPGARLSLGDVTPAQRAALIAHAEKCRACGRVFDDGQRSGRYALGLGLISLADNFRSSHDKEDNFRFSHEKEQPRSAVLRQRMQRSRLRHSGKVKAAIAIAAAGTIVAVGLTRSGHPSHPATFPAVTGVSPASGSTAGGSTVTITGTGLAGATAVRFGGVAGTITADSGTQITATTPPGTGTVDTTVTTAAITAGSGTQITATGTVDITVTTPAGISHPTTADHYTYTPPRPAVTGVSPASGSTAGGSTVTITGTGLAGATAVRFGGVAGTITADSGTQITATTPPGTGTVDTTVTTPAGTSKTTAAGHYTYTTHPKQTQSIFFTAPATGTAGGSAALSAAGGGSGNPVVFSVDPASGPGVCTLSGATVTYTAAGNCVIDANQAGTGSYAPAPQVQRTITLNRIQAPSGSPTPSRSPTPSGSPTSQCGHPCVSLYNQQFGPADVSTVSGGSITIGQVVILSAAAPSPTEEWLAPVRGTVSEFVADGLMNAIFDQPYGPDQVFEFEYAPGGSPSGLCLGIASSPSQNTQVTLQPCGVTAKTTWIDDTAAASGGYAPFINGSGTKYPAPYVLTANTVGDNLTTQVLRTEAGVITKAQMWGFISGGRT